MFLIWREPCFGRHCCLAAALRATFLALISPLLWRAAWATELLASLPHAGLSPPAEATGGR